MHLLDLDSNKNKVCVRILTCDDPLSTFSLFV